MSDVQIQNLLLAFSHFVGGDKNKAAAAFNGLYTTNLIEYLIQFDDKEIYDVLDLSVSGSENLPAFIRAEENEEIVTNFFLKAIDKSVKQWRATKKGSAAAS
jgi:hypothetical protein